MFSEREGVLMKKGKGERARGVEGGRGTMIAEGRVSARGERKVRGKFSAGKGRVSVMNGDSHTLKRTELRERERAEREDHAEWRTRTKRRREGPWWEGGGGGEPTSYRKQH